MDDLLYPAQCVDGLVHAEGGAKLRAALVQHPVLERRSSGEHVRCHVGGAVLTAGAFNELPFDAIVHTVPPFWPCDAVGEDLSEYAQWSTELHSCYRASFRAAVEFATGGDRAAAGLAIAMPVLGSGARGAPMAPAVRVLAEAAAQLFEASGAKELAAGNVSLRVVMNPASFERDVDAVSAAVNAAMEKASPQQHHKKLGATPPTFA
jgi:O-acetyl-ADP-ribose deacetylase (regulator of RNase III)